MKEPIPSVYQGLPVVNSEAMRTLDRLASEKFGIPAAQLMENAGRLAAEEIAAYLQGAGVRGEGRDAEESNLAPLASAVLHPSPLTPRPCIVVCCGRGSNGGDGLAAARYLAAKGYAVSASVCPARDDKPSPELVRENLEKASAAGVQIRDASDAAALAESLGRSTVVVDALLGTGSKGKPQGLIGDMIRAVTRAKKPVFALDIPSGIDPDTGYHSGVFITAEETLTFGLPKKGLLAAHAQRYVGRLKVLDIGYPKELLSTLPA